MPIGRSNVYPRLLTLAVSLSPRLFELLQHLDQLGLRQMVLAERVAGPVGRGSFGERGAVRRIGIPVGKTLVFGKLSAATHLPVLGRTADLVHVHGDDAVTLGLAVAAARLWDIPVILGLDDEAMVAPRPALQPVFRAALRRVAAIVASSREQAEGLVAEGAPPGQVHLMPAMEAGQHAAALLDLYRMVWAKHLGRQVAVWHPTPG